MTKYFACFALLVSMAFPALAAETRFRHFSVDVPGEWHWVDGPAEEGATYTLVFSKNDRKAMVSLSVAPALGQTAAAIALDICKKLECAQAPLENNGQFGFPFEQEGISGFCVVSVDQRAGLFTVTSLWGDQKEGAAFLRRVASPEHPGLVARPDCFP